MKISIDPPKIPVIRPLMQPLLITSLVALLIALIYIQRVMAQRNSYRYWRDHYQSESFSWNKSCFNWRTKYDEQVNLVNKLQVDNALLKAELRKKHRRVPKL